MNGRMWLKASNTLALLALLTACGENGQAPPPTPIHRSTPGATKSEREAVIDLKSIGLESLDPEINAITWNEEKFAANAKKQFEKLSQLLLSGRLSESDVSKLVDTQYHGGPLRPPTLQTVYEDASIVVTRPDSTLEDPYEGTSGFVTGWSELIEPLDSLETARTHFKIFRVAVSDEEIKLLVYFELTGRAVDGTLQQRAVWECRWTNSTDDSPKLSSIVTTQFEEAIGKSSSQFRDGTAAVLGNNPSYRQQLIQSTDYWIDRIELRYGIDPGAWLGMAVADINGDGLDDLYLCQPGGLPNRLFLQNKDGTALDTSATSGVDWLDHSHAALFVDLDNDSDQDLVLALKRGLLIMSNDGRGEFQVKSVKPIPKSNPYALSAADYDEDGFLDIYVCCYSMRRAAVARSFIQRPVPYHDANNGGRNLLLQNQRNWQFKDVTRHVGLEQNNRRFSFAASWEDYDNDGDLDLYVANDYGRNNLYRNDSGRFSDQAATARVEDISAGMSVSWGDYDNNGWMDLYVSNMFSSAGNRIAYQRRFRASDTESTRASYQRHARGNSLFRNMGDGLFQDVSVQAGVTMGRWAWGSTFADLNNDGLDDLVVANGFITQEDTSDL